MIQLRLLIIIAVIANVLTVIGYKYAASQPGGTSTSLAFVVVWMPVIWISTIILAIIVAVKGRKKIFVGNKWILATTILLFCTPVPLFIASQLTGSSNTGVARSSSSFSRKDGRIYKTEKWYYTGNYLQTYVVMHFSADSTDEAREGEFALKKDSTWTYFTIKGDTLKVEKYKAGELLSTTQPAKK